MRPEDRQQAGCEGPAVQQVPPQDTAGLPFSQTGGLDEILLGLRLGDLAGQGEGR